MAGCVCDITLTSFIRLADCQIEPAKGVEENVPLYIRFFRGFLATRFSGKMKFFSVPVFRGLVLCPSLDIMVFLTENLPVAPIPEQLLISAVRNNVIDHCGFSILALRHTPDAQGVSRKIGFTDFLPRTTVSSTHSTPYFLRMQRFVLLAVLGSRGNQFRTTRMAAWDFRTRGH